MPRLILPVILVGALGVAAAPQPAPDVTGGNGSLYVGGYSKKILIVDEATETVTGEIPLDGIPRQLALSHDRTRFYLTNAEMERFQVVDIASRTIVDTFQLSRGSRRVRIRAFEVDPLDRSVILLTRAAVKQIDRFEIEPAALLQYDLERHDIIRTIPWPDGEERDRVRMLFSPDGTLLYLFAEDVVILETENFTEVDRWELSRPIEDGFGRIDLGSLDILNDEPGFFTGLFTVRDPVANRRMIGVARVDLARKSVDFYTVGPDAPVSFSLAPGRKKAYGLMREIGRYEFWTFDLVNRRLESKREFEGRPRMSLKTSSNGRLLYIYQAGNTIDLYDAATYRYLRTITLDADMTTDMYVMPGPGGGSQ